MDEQIGESIIMDHIFYSEQFAHRGIVGYFKDKVLRLNCCGAIDVKNLELRIAENTPGNPFVGLIDINNYNEDEVFKNVFQLFKEEFYKIDWESISVFHVLDGGKNSYSEIKYDKLVNSVYYNAV